LQGMKEAEIIELGDRHPAFRCVAHNETHPCVSRPTDWRRYIW